MGWTIGDLEFDSRRGLGIFLFTTASKPALGPTQLPIQWVPGALSLELKRLGREADHSLPCSAEVKNAWSYTSTPQYTFMVWCLVKHRDNFTFIFTFYVNQESPCWLTDWLTDKCFGNGTFTEATPADLRGDYKWCEWLHKFTGKNC
jgi:hypothetical protein